MKISLLSSLETINNNSIICSQGEVPQILDDKQKLIVERYIKQGEKLIELPESDYTIWVCVNDNDNEAKEDYRKMGSSVFAQVKKAKVKDLVIYADTLSHGYALAFTEGFCLSSYSFLHYFKNEVVEKETLQLENIQIVHPDLFNSDIDSLNSTVESVFWARDMINEPVSVMNAVTFASDVSEKLSSAGVEVEVLDKKQIESLRMGGLLAVNRGSIDPPTLTIAIWKPDNAVNEKPYAIVGKGVMFDTGGLSLKPTAGSMDSMKSDMSGAAAVAAAMYNIAKQKLPVYVIALLPATDNRPSGNAYTPGDVIKMYNGLHVEVLNTDAEGRMILADAISYAGKYEPQLIMDMATLTGAAAVAIGTQASVVMGTAGDDKFDILKLSGDEVHERVVRFPFYEEYDKLIESDIADLKNIGGRDAGAITAGKFLSNFTDNPFVHIDIAGPAYINQADSYKTKGGTGYGVRLLTQFFKNISKAVNKN